MNRRRRNGILLSVLLACCLGFVGGGNATAQERHWGGGPGGFGAGSGAGFSLVPSVVADALLVPSLTKAQQTKIRTLYVDYRVKSAGRMEVMNKLRGSSYHGRGGDSGHSSDRPGSGEGRRGKSSEHSDNDYSGQSKKDGPGDAKRPRSSKGPENSMDSASSNLRRTVFMSMLKEFQKFQESIIAVLNEKQHVELKEIAKKAGSPDYFAVRHYDIMNAD